jgi:two-component system, chemotaxis family, protein-glutamate methylesterase/glutaminase
MSGHDIVVIGTSAGGLKAVGAVLSQLPADLPAAVFVVQHLAADQNSVLPKLLGDVSRLPVHSPKDGDGFQQGRVYVASPDHHLLVNDDRVRVLRGPQENRFRPSIDALFRSAARSHGSRVIGVVLTGSLHDGSVGLQTIKMRGGITIVQDPDEAEYPSMPRTALRYVNVDHIASIADAGALLVRKVTEPSVDQAAFPTTEEIEIESNIAEQVMNTREFLEGVERIGTRTTYSCPDCNGAMWQIGDGEPLKLRCHVGHSFTGEVLSSGQNRNIEAALWTAIRLMEEKVTFSRQLAEREREQSMQDDADVHEREADALDEQITRLRDIIVEGSATLRFISEGLA